MGFAERLIHSLVIVRATGNETEDDYGQAVPGSTIEYPVKGLPQPKTASEVAAVAQAGAVIGNWTVFLQPADVAGADAILHRKNSCPIEWPHDLPDMRFEITGIRNAAGVGHHYEVDANAVEGSGVLEAGS